MWREEWQVRKRVSVAQELKLNLQLHSITYVDLSHSHRNLTMLVSACCNDDDEAKPSTLRNVSSNGSKMGRFRGFEITHVASCRLTLRKLLIVFLGPHSRHGADALKYSARKTDKAVF
jgi:hypothetical protein